MKRATHKTDRPSGQEGFTLVELLVVLGVIVLLATLVGPRVIGYLGKARSDAALAQLKNIESAVELYFLDNGSYPPAASGLEALVSAPAGVASWNGPYLKNRDALTDPWGRPYAYAVPGQHGEFDLYSLGRDGAEGGESEDRDVTSW